MKALLVDDELYVVEYIKHLADWDALGYCVILTATTGSVAKEMIVKETPELLVTDIRMPGISGIDLLRFVKEASPKTVVIVLSGYNEFFYAQQAIKFNAIDYLLKPITARDLTAALKNATKIIAEKNIVNKTSSALPDNTLQPDIKTDKNTYGVIATLCDYIDNHYSEEISLEMLSKIVYMHPNSVSRMFKQCIGKTLNSYITDVRLEKAAKLLKESTLKVQDICEMVGYHKVQHFIRLFKKKYSTTPEKFRLTFIR